MRRSLVIGGSLFVAAAVGALLYVTANHTGLPISDRTFTQSLETLPEYPQWPTAEERAKCEEETQDWRYRECLDRLGSTSIFNPSFVVRKPAGLDPSIIRRANEDDPEASLQYGYHLVAKAVVEGRAPDDAVPYLMTAALSGDIGAHVQLALIEVVTKDDGDLVRAWAHLDVALRDMPQSAPDYRRSKMHFEEITAGFTDADRDAAKALSEDYRETMQQNRNLLK